MGYSISIRVTSAAKRKRMLRFMGRNFRGWPSVATLKDSFRSAGDPTDDLDYDRSKIAIGFNYASHLCGWEREYTFAVLRWMALTVGNRKYFPTWSRTKKFPFLVPDGEEPWPLIVATEAQALKLREDRQWAAVDELGMRSLPPFDISITLDLPEKKYQKFQAEVLRKIGPCPKEGDGFAWRHKYNQLLVKYAQPTYDWGVGLIRSELQRLDKLWERV